MNITVQWASIAGNAIAVITAMGVLGRVAWKRLNSLVAQTVSAPLTQLQASVDELKDDVAAVKEDAKRANDRLDRHLETHGMGQQHG